MAATAPSQNLAPRKGAPARVGGHHAVCQQHNGGEGRALNQTGPHRLMAGRIGLPGKGKLRLGRDNWPGRPRPRSQRRLQARC
jgi:hypothetical protein